MYLFFFFLSYSVTSSASQCSCLVGCLSAELRESRLILTLSLVKLIRDSRDGARSNCGNIHRISVFHPMHVVVVGAAGVGEAESVPCEASHLPAGLPDGP